MAMMRHCEKHPNSMLLWSFITETWYCPVCIWQPSPSLFGPPVSLGLWARWRKRRRRIRLERDLWDGLCAGTLRLVPRAEYDARRGPLGGTGKPSASTSTKARGTTRPETDTRAGCSSYEAPGSTQAAPFYRTAIGHPAQRRASSFTAPGSSGGETAARGGSGEPPERAA